MIRLILASLSAIALVSSPALAWGSEGPRGDGENAELYVTEDTHQAIQAIFVPETMPARPNWRDRASPSYTANGAVAVGAMLKRGSRFERGGSPVRFNHARYWSQVVSLWRSVHTSSKFH
ncbi:MAG: hypothetical protein JJU26_10265 [Oceanicaulis sp.]|nr:hypothetical protein [Oceanicaulis sp.]